MGRITTSVGLVSGFPIQDTVDKLVNLQASTRDALTARNKTLSDQKTEVLKLETLLVGLQFTTNRLGTSALFNQRTVSSSDDSLLAASSSGQPPLGSYQFTPIQLAQAQQLQSSRFISNTAPIGAGTVSFRYGGFVNSGVSLDLLNGGTGISAGKIRITDGSGASSEIDLSYARTVDDVLDAINKNATIQVTAVADGDRLRLIDDSGQSLSHLKVQEVGGGTTAASLGLGGIDTAAAQATGQDVLRLFGDLMLDKLNNGNGVRFDSALSDLKLTFRDGSQAEVDLRRVGTEGTHAQGTTDALFGTNAQLVFTAVQAGAAGSGVHVSFVNDDTVTAGQETVNYDAQAKTLTFKIDEGHTTANQIIQALQSNSTASAAFTAARVSGGNGTSLVDVSDTATTGGPKSTATTSGTLSNDAKLTISALQSGDTYDNVAISFVDNPNISAGGETVAYDDSDPDHKTLTFQIAAGSTKASDVIAALNNDPVAGQIFHATLPADSNGSGFISTSDTGTTAGGQFNETSTATSELTIQDVLSALNNATGKLQAAIGPDGDRIVLTDLTADNGGTFSITDLHGSHAAEDLGLTSAAAGDVLTGRRTSSGLKTALLSSLNGGAGLGTLGLVQLTDRSGASASVDLSAAETLDDVLDAINNSGLGIAAQLNDARNGILVTDTTGSTAHNLTIANGDGAGTADKLGIAVDSATTSKTSGSLKLQSVSENTLLASLNGGAGVAQGTIQITDTQGHTGRLTISSSTTTIGDVLHDIERLGLSITARINDAGDGIAIVDTAQGSGKITVTEGTGTAGHDLHLLGTSESVDIGGTPTQVLDGSTAYTITLSATDSLQDLVNKINALDSGVQTSILNDGSSVKPYRFTLFNQNSGSVGNLAFDTSQVNFSVSETVKAQDALLLVGAPGSGGTLASSASNTFSGVLPDVTFTVKGASSTPVTVTVGSSNSNLTTVVQSFVDNFNLLYNRIKDDTKYDETTQSRAIFQGDSSTLRIQSELSNLVSGRIFGAGSIQSLESLGIKVKQDGTLSFEPTLLQAKFSDNPSAVKEFFSKADTGVSDRFKKLIDQLAGEKSSLLINRSNSLDDKIQANSNRIAFLTARLEILRTRLTTQFQQMELAISKIQANSTALTSIAQLASQWNNFIGS